MHLLKDANVEGKTVFLRVDLDVPLSEIRNPKSEIRDIEDDSRLKAALPTMEYLLKQKAKIILAGHMGRPDTSSKFKVQSAKLSLEPVARWFSCHPELVSGSPVSRQASLKSGEMLKQVQHDMNKAKLGEFEGWEIGPNIFLLENLRFNQGEEKNDPEFSKNLASLAEVYVNDAFAMCHRSHASVVGITKYLPHFAGLHLQEEVRVLSEVLKNPKRPLVVVIGGAKLETKLPLVEKMHHVADYVLVGGKLVEDTKALLKMQHQRINLKPGERKSVLLTADLIPDESDITPNSVQNFLQIITLAKTVIWNGPLGKISKDETKMSQGEDASLKLAEGLVRSSAFTIVGGGDTVGFLEKACLLDHFACMPKNRCFLSTGGGAMLSFLSGEKLPGIEALL